MSKADSSGAIRFTTEVLNEATEILRPHARPHALPLLLELLWVWEKEALPGYLSLKMKSAAQLLKIRKIAADLVASISALDDGNRFEIACKAELQARVLLDERWDLAVAFGPPDLIPAGERKRDNALSWLRDVIAAIKAPEPKRPRVPGQKRAVPSPSDNSTRAYLIARDLGAIFHVTTGEAPTRRNDPQSGPYGPFFKFLNCIKGAVPELGSVDEALKTLVRFYPRPKQRRGKPPGAKPDSEDSEWFCNLQFRHPCLWEKLKRLPTIISHF